MIMKCLLVKCNISKFRIIEYLGVGVGYTRNQGVRVGVLSIDSTALVTAQEHQSLMRFFMHSAALTRVFCTTSLVHCSYWPRQGTNSPFCLPHLFPFKNTMLYIYIGTHWPTQFNPEDGQGMYHQNMSNIAHSHVQQSKNRININNYSLWSRKSVEVNLSSTPTMQN
jgi:hypothetical protein